MSDRVVDAEIEDVLDSIRKLIADSGRPDRAVRPPLDGKLVLTPAFRVHDGARDDQTVPEVTQTDKPTSGVLRLIDPMTTDSQTTASLTNPDRLDLEQTQATASEPVTTKSPQPDPAPSEPRVLIRRRTAAFEPEDEIEDLENLERALNGDLESLEALDGPVEAPKPVAPEAVVGASGASADHAQDDDEAFAEAIAETYKTTPDDSSEAAEDLYEISGQNSPAQDMRLEDRAAKLEDVVNATPDLWEPDGGEDTAQSEVLRFHAARSRREHQVTRDEVEGQDAPYAMFSHQDAPEAPFIDVQEADDHDRADLTFVHRPVQSDATSDEDGLDTQKADTHTPDAQTDDLVLQDLVARLVREELLSDDDANVAGPLRQVIRREIEQILSEREITPKD